MDKCRAIVSFDYYTEDGKKYTLLKGDIVDIMSIDTEKVELLHPFYNEKIILPFYIYQERLRPLVVTRKIFIEY